jgi:S-adenosylmethionine hydrolase
MPSNAIITLLTDFGTADYFVGAMKGVILSAQPEVTFVDISHEIPPHDVTTAAFTLLACYRDFPVGTIHLAVIDPGVGSERRPIAISAGGYNFVGPDNGLFSHVLDRESEARVFRLNRQEHFRAGPSTTFHGRDIFAPVAGALASGMAISELGDEINDPVRLAPLASCIFEGDGVWNAAIIHIDRFGNCVTNLAREALPAHVAGALTIDVNGRTITKVHRCYADAANDQLFAIWGSAGFLELSAYCASAAQRLEASCGDPVRVALRP